MSGYRCSGCGDWDDELPFSYHAAAPGYWSAELEHGEDSELMTDRCVIHGDS